YSLLAARSAAEVFAYHEAEALAHRGVKQLHALPDTTERARQELQFQIVLGDALQATRGYAAAETGQAYGRAHALCQQLGDVPEKFLALWGLWFFNVVRLDLATARELGEELSRLAGRGQDPVQRMRAHFALEVTTCYQGEFTLALENFRAAV